MCRYLHKATEIIMNQGKMTPQKEHKKLPVPQFKIIVLNMLREPQENTNQQFSDNL